MNKIISFEYCNSTFSIYEDAYNDFLKYEKELETYFLKQPDGEEIFQDLKYRIAEIFSSKSNKENATISIDDVQQLKTTIGTPQSLDENENNSENNSETSIVPITTTTEKEKGFFRNEADKILAGVCSGIANYFMIDAIAVRLIFVLITLFGYGFGILVYIILWIVFPAKVLKLNTTKKLFRNPRDKFFGGVCSGLASFFKTSSWVVRVIFLIPIIISIVGNNSFLKYIFIPHFNNSLIGFSIVFYIILWISTKYAITKTDFMLLNGEPINLDTMSKLHPLDYYYNRPSGLQTFLKVIAYLLIAFFGFIFIVTFFSMSAATAAISPTALALNILNTPFLKFLGIATLLGLFILPILAFVVWCIRKLGKFKSPNKKLRWFFGSLFFVGFLSSLILISTIASDFNTHSKISYTNNLDVVGDTLFVKLNKDIDTVDNLIIETKESISLNDFVSVVDGKRELKFIQFDTEESDSNIFSYTTKISAFGNTKKSAEDNARLIKYSATFDGKNTLYVHDKFVMDAKVPYRIQYANVTINLPKNKVVIFDKNVATMTHSGNNFIFNNHNVKVYHNGVLQKYSKDKVVSRKDETEYNEEEESDEEKEDEEIEKLTSEMEKELEKAENEMEKTKEKMENDVEKTKEKMEKDIEKLKEKIDDLKAKKHH